MMFFAFGVGTSSEQALSVAAGPSATDWPESGTSFCGSGPHPFYWIIAPVFRRMRALTTSDFFQARYDSSTATLYSCLGIVMSVVFMAGALYGSGEMIEGLAGGIDPVTGEPYFPMEYAVAGMTVLFVLYGWPEAWAPPSSPTSSKAS